MISTADDASKEEATVKLDIHLPSASIGNDKEGNIEPEDEFFLTQRYVDSQFESVSKGFVR